MLANYVLYLTQLDAKTSQLDLTVFSAQPVDVSFGVDKHFITGTVHFRAGL